MWRPFALLTLLVGLCLSLGFAWLAVDAALDFYAFPDKPTELSLPELAAMQAVPRGTWVRLEGDLEVEAGPVTPNEGGPWYALLRNREHTARVVVTGEQSAQAKGLTGRIWTGVPTLHRTRSEDTSQRELPHALAFPGTDWPRSAPRAVILWTHSGPKNSRLGLILLPVLTLLGLFVSANGLAQLRRRSEAKMDTVWTGDELPASVRLGALAGRQTKIYARILLVFGLAWLAGFGFLEVSKGRPGLHTAFLLGFGVLLLFFGFALSTRARRVSGHEYFAHLVWLPVLRSYAVRSEGIATGVQAYDLEMPPGTALATLTVHSSPLHGGFVFRDAARAEVLAARPLHSSEVIVLSGSLREIWENPLAPMAHPRHRLRRLS